MRKPPDPKRMAYQAKKRRINEEFPMPKGGDIEEVMVMNPEAVLLNGIFSPEELDAISAHMRALLED